ncbi:polysaccharide export outer membrane protein [Hymenobacter daecheongensis DSM 21074]|uniref:Polysaccharide export outer membrane protein n=1 Tax=Hymenobacter daecheongensis DSM 21074 TaxID=1121955 RepID=A0A1M6KIR8_9BACT|nr:polysaccharide biosynthesis/export family protein [Hymenobacter daecheongensis]SHJ58868.1 polysaccharide export outer membrane protein [Hymenobacter daecheongensis DSM 21074]
MRPTHRFCLYLLFFAAAVWLSGCVAQRTLPYLQGPDYSTQSPVSVPNEPLPYRIQPSDVLSIRVQSVQPVLNDMFNITDTRSIMAGGDPSTLFLAGYSVDVDGFINLPTVGKVKVTGMTLEEAQAQLQQQVGKFVRDANVLVKLLSFKITVLGEVASPGRYFIYNAQATLLEGLGLAGDLTEFGNRQNVKLIRQTPTGSEVVLLNLTDPNLLRSKYYYLLPNDALYVEPVAARTKRGNANNLGIVFGGISALVLLLSYLKTF